MSRVAVIHYEFVGLKDGEEPLAALPLARRLTPLQTAVLFALARWERAAPEMVRALLNEARVPIFTATHFGELDTLVALQRSLFQQALPVSPAGFQNSLPSAAGGYVAIVRKLTQGQIVFANGHLSLDLMLHWAHHKIRCGLTPAVVCINAAERMTNSPEHRAEAEVIVLGQEACSGWQLAAVAHIGDVRQVDIPSGALRDDETPGHIAALRLDRAKGPNLTRVAVASDGEGVMTHWCLES